MADFLAVSFDLDGTLWDSARCADHVLEIVLPKLMPHLPEDDPSEVIAAFNAVFLDLVKKYGLASDRSFSHVERFQRLLDLYGVKKERLACHLSSAYVSARRLAMRSFLRDGAIDLLKMLRRNNIKVGVITNGIPAIQRQTICTLGFEAYLDFTIISGIEGYNKPDARLFERALEMTGVNPHQMLHVGDSPITDIVGALGAGMAVAWLQTGRHQFPRGFPKPQYTITRLTEVFPIVCGSS